MENLVVASFQDMDNAVKALNKLNELNELDDIIIYNMVMIQKKGEQFQVLYREGPDTQDLPAEGAFVGSLIGALAGPIGMALGMLTGVMAGAVNEDDTETFFDEFLNNVTKQLQPGSYAVVIDVEEDTAVFIDSYLEPFHAVIVRKDITDQYDKYDQEHIEELNKQIDNEEKELDTASEKNKAAIKAKISNLKSKREERIKKFKTRRENSKKQLQEKIENLKKKITASQDKRNERLKAHKEKLEDKLDTWAEDVAWEVI